MSANQEANSSPNAIRVITLNCWGLKYLSKHRHARLLQIGHQLATAKPSPQIVGLQECWTQEDYMAIRDLTKHILPYGKFYHSGFFGSGLVILSAWPIEESSMYAYPLNGRPAAFYRGDWFVGKGVASAWIRIGPGEKDIVEVFCTHLHAPYEAEQSDSYACHRTAQAWEIAKKMRHAAERGHLVLGLGDFNMVPLSLAHRLIEAHSPARDAWRLLKPDSTVGSSKHVAEKARGQDVPTIEECLQEHGSTCDSILNTWRWSKNMQKDFNKGSDHTIDLQTPDPDAQRLDYIFFADQQGKDSWRVSTIEVGMTQRHPELKVSLSDHFSVEATLVRQQQATAIAPIVSPLPDSMYDEILQMTSSYMLRERKQRTWRMTHFYTQLAVTSGCLVAVWWSPRNWVSFILMLISSIGLSAGMLDGLMGGLFVKQEIRALKEFQWEIENARKMQDKLGSSIKQ